MNALSAWTFYRRHKRRAGLLLSLSIVVTVGLYSLVALVWGVFVEPGRLAYMAFLEFSLVTPQSTVSGPDPAVLARLEANPDIAQIIPASLIRIELPGVMPGQGFQFDLLGLMEEDAAYLLERFAATVEEGRMPQPGVAEIALSEDVATMLNVKVGDNYIASSLEFYRGMEAPPEPTSFEVVGTLESDIELGIVSLEFLEQHEQYRQFPGRFLVVAQDGREAAVEGFLRSEILTLETGVVTRQMLSERILEEALPALVMLLPVILLVGIAFSFVIVVANQLANTRRLPEFGILHAMGHSLRWLVRRLTVETGALALAGWAIGIGLSYLGLHLLKVTVFAARGHALDYIAWLPVLFSLLTPAAIAGFTFVAARRTLTRLDPVAIVERRELSAESWFRTEGDQRRPRTALANSTKPLAAATFYRRHRRRAVLLISAMGLMILAVTLFIFALAIDADAQKPFLSYLSRVSLVRSAGIVQSLDPGVVARVEAHPAVERVIPFAPRYSMLKVRVPPFASAEASPFGVYAEDMEYLVELYGLELIEGRLPRPGTNEMAIPEALVQNRGLGVGDLIGDPDRPAYPGAPALEAEFVISGVLARPTVPEDGGGLGFVSLEFLENQPLFPLPDVLPLIVVPKTGEKDTLDDWLEEELAGIDVSVLSYRQEVSRIQDQARQDMFSIALLEGAIALVAAIGLAVLNHVFIAQRQAEFGVLHALGYSRRQLVRRVLGETAFTTGIAWGLTAVAGLIAMLWLRFVAFEPLGLTFELFNVRPWLYTLPIPIAVIVVTTGTTARALAKLDAVSIVERR